MMLFLQTGDQYIAIETKILSLSHIKILSTLLKIILADLSAKHPPARIKSPPYVADYIRKRNNTRTAA